MSKDNSGLFQTGKSHPQSKNFASVEAEAKNKASPVVQNVRRRTAEKDRKVKRKTDNPGRGGQYREDKRTDNFRPGRVMDIFSKNGKGFDLERVRAHRRALVNMSAHDWTLLLRRAGYKLDPEKQSTRKGSSGTAWTLSFRKGENKGKPINSVLIHHVPGKHKAPYVKFGIVNMVGNLKIIDNRKCNYDPAGQKKANLIFVDEDKSKKGK